VELLQDRGGYDSGVAGLSGGVVRVGSLVRAVGVPVCADSFLDLLSAEGRCDACGLALRRDEVVGDILDEEAFSLCSVSFPDLQPSSYWCR